MLGALSRATVALLAVGCNFCSVGPAAPTATTDGGAVHVMGVASAGAQPVVTPTFPAGTPLAYPNDPGLQQLVSSAIDDLANRLGIGRDQVLVVEVLQVTWPDPSLGCPRPGMSYKQVPVDGLLIRLASGGTRYEYHSGGSGAPFLCE